MPKKDILDQAWTAWTKWVQVVVDQIPEALEIAQAKQRKKVVPLRPLAKIPPPAGLDLKTSSKPANRVKLSRDLKVLRRPELKVQRDYEMKQMKRTKPELTESSLKAPPKTYEEKLVRRVDPPQPFDIDEKYLETPKERKDRVERIADSAEKKKEKKGKVPDRFIQPQMSKLRRHLLFLNPGTLKLVETHRAFVNGGDLPKWTQYLGQSLTFDSKNLYFENLPLAGGEARSGQRPLL